MSEPEPRDDAGERSDDRFRHGLAEDDSAEHGGGDGAEREKDRHARRRGVRERPEPEASERWSTE